MMRTAPDQDWKKISKLFHDYMLGQGDFLASNCAHGEKVSLLRTIPHEDFIDQQEYAEIANYESNSARRQPQHIDFFNVNYRSILESEDIPLVSLDYLLRFSAAKLLDSVKGIPILTLRSWIITVSPAAASPETKSGSLGKPSAL